MPPPTKTGGSGQSDAYVKKWGGRREVFEIADDEQLIGCELDYDDIKNFIGVIWLKMKL